MVEVKCGYCGARFEVPEGVRYAVCPYCGTTIELSTGQVLEEHYYYPPRLSGDDAYVAALSKASMLPGSPEDLRSSSAYASSRLHYVPLYLCRARAVVEGCEGAVEEVERSIPALRIEELNIPVDYRFPSIGRTPFKPSIIKRGIYHQPELDPGDACSGIESWARSRAAREALLAGCTGSLASRAEVGGVIHYPFWEVRYRYGESEYRGVVDAVDAVVVYVEYPIPASKRIKLLAAGAAAALLALATATGIGLLSGSGAHGALAGLVGAAGSFAPMLGRAASRKGIYRYKVPSVQRLVVKEG